MIRKARLCLLLAVVVVGVLALPSSAPATRVRMAMSDLRLAAAGVVRLAGWWCVW
jgi:hypothetical protein